jgi:hypothetical protein
VSCYSSINIPIRNLFINSIVVTKYYEDGIIFSHHQGAKVTLCGTNVEVLVVVHGEAAAIKRTTTHFRKLKATKKMDGSVQLSASRGVSVLRKLLFSTTACVFQKLPAPMNLVSTFDC